MAHGDIRISLGLQEGQNLKEHRTYRIWYGMRQRCQYAKHHAYYRYGGRGITVCEEWSSFERFLADMGHPPTEKHTLDRRNSNGNYEPKNCKWSTKKEQAENRRNSIIVNTPIGLMALSDAAAYYGLKPQTIHGRIRRGNPPAKWFVPLMKTNGEKA